MIAGYEITYDHGDSSSSKLCQLSELQLDPARSLAEFLTAPGDSIRYDDTRGTTITVEALDEDTLNDRHLDRMELAANRRTAAYEDGHEPVEDTLPGSPDQMYEIRVTDPEGGVVRTWERTAEAAQAWADDLLARMDTADARETSVEIERKS